MKWRRRTSCGSGRFWTRLAPPAQCQRLTERSASRALEALLGVELAPWARTEMEELVHFLSRREF